MAAKTLEDQRVEQFADPPLSNGTEPELQTVEAPINVLDLVPVHEAQVGQIDRVTLYTSIAVGDGASKQDKLRLYNALAGPSESIDEHIKRPIHVRDIVIHEITLPETGERIARSVLLGSDGQFAAVSRGVFSSLDKLIAIFGPGPYDPEMVLVPVKQKTRAGFQTIILTVQE